MGAIAVLQNFRQGLRQWWAEFSLQTKLMAVLTLLVSLVMSGITFWAVNDIQTDARLNDTRFGRDLGLLLAADTAPLVAERNLEEVARLSREFYDRSSSIRYILFADPEGEIYFGIPFSATEVRSSLEIARRIQVPPELAVRPDRPAVRQHLTPAGLVTDVFVSLQYGGQEVGIVAVGIDPNPTAVASSNLTLDVTTAVFVSIWAMVILGAASNAIAVTRPIRELVAGVKSIAAGNFQQRIDLPFGGELGELIRRFNEMAAQLASYQAQNIEELAAGKAKLETLVATIADGAILLDEELRVVLANRAAGRIFRLETPPAIGTHILHLLPENVTAEVTRPLTQVATGERATCELRFTAIAENPGGFSGSLGIWIESVLGNQGNLKGIAMTVQDITREVELNAAQSRFISNVSHELRTPLFNIKSFIETLYEYGDSLTEEQRQEFLDTANRETDRLTRLVNDVLDLSRLESGRQYSFGAVEVARPVEQTLRTYQLNARDKGLTLQAEIDADLPPVWGNYDLLLQVFSNLVGNALKFTPAGGRVTVRARAMAAANPRMPGRDIRQVRIEVEDTGIGIEAKDQQRIFDRFFRVENSVHTLEGTGLGLSIVRNIIDKHHSAIHLRSEPGKGSCFWFELGAYSDVCELNTLPELAPVAV
ncbi:MAG: HAMP domain-containing protein [Oscillatoriales cyanobacterium SM2_1_8]|nr:HAMP domain-containing protein [Oscillatoriales cyanobacterium SM2_1_8]